MITPESIQQVISRSDIVEVIGQFVSLKKRGANYIANCPFHNEKSPSFNVNPTRGIFKCFGCGKGGDVVSFVEEYEKFSFVEAIRWLAGYYQIELVETEAKEEHKLQAQTEESLRIVNEFAARYFQDILEHDEEGQLIGGGYFKERGLLPGTIAHFRLGYCPDKWDAFAHEALAKGHSLALLEKAGLVKLRDGKPYDAYRGRVVFPIFSATGKILGFGARILKKTDRAPKYVNSPENELYNKSKILYGLYQSKQSIGQQDECLLVEGYTDVLSLYQGGVTHVVASSGTSLTEGQLKLIGNLTRNLTILYDGDAAGTKAALRGLDMAVSEGFNVKLVSLPDGEDPDSYMQGVGPDAFRAYIQNHKRDIIDFRLDLGLKEAEGDPIKKSHLVNEIAETISKINKAEDFALRQYYLKESAKRLEVDEEGMVALVNKLLRERIQKDQRQEERRLSQSESDPENAGQPIAEAPAAHEEQGGSGKDYSDEWQLLKVLLEYGPKPYKESETVANHFFETIDIELLEHPISKQIVHDYYRYWSENQQLPDLRYFSSHIDKGIRQKVADLLQPGYSVSPNWMQMYKIEVNHGEELYESDIESTFAYFELKLLRKLVAENMEHLQKETDPQRTMLLLRTHQSLKSREKELMTIVIVK